MTDDWRGIRGARAGGSSKDASYAIRCGYDEQRLYVLIDIRDERVLRNARANAKTDDHIAIDLSVGAAGSRGRGVRTGRVVVFPGTRKAKPSRTFEGRGPPAWLQIEDSLQRRGWSVEIALPLARIRGFTRSAPGISAAISYHDADLASERKIQSRVAWNGVLEVGGGASVYRAFLKAAGLTARDVRLDVMADVDGAKGTERVVAGGAVVGVLDEQFAYFTLPVASASDVLAVKVVQLRDDGTSSILTHYRQHGNGGSRDVVAIWNADGTGRFNQLLAFEVRKQMGERVLKNRWKLVPRGSLRKPDRRRRGRGKRGRGKRGRDILIEVADRDAVGWDEDNYAEAPAPDVRPILLPWSDQTSAVYYFEGNAVLGGDPARRR